MLTRQFSRALSLLYLTFLLGLLLWGQPGASGGVKLSGPGLQPAAAGERLLLCAKNGAAHCPGCNVATEAAFAGVMATASSAFTPQALTQNGLKPSLRPHQLRQPQKLPSHSPSSPHLASLRTVVLLV